MPDVIIMGGGPAGVSAALYTVRAGLSTTILASGAGALEKSDRIENYYGFAEPVSGRRLLENGIAQAKRLGARIVTDEVVGLSWDGEFLISTKRSAYRAPFAVMATGASRSTPKISGLTEFEGKGVSYCAVCDGFFYRKKPVVVLGAGDYALHEAAELLPVASSVTILTDGKEPQAAFPKETAVETRKIAKLTGEGTLHRIRFEDGTELETAGLFVAVGVAGSADLARKVGAQVNGVSVAVDEKRRTNVPGLYAAGDCTGGLLQISKAVCDGALAGTDIVREFRQRAAAPSARM
ncbi:NAD(P)/FAD-dependent oxidoreductase [Caproiciproducens sp. NJN-50]|uniref:NAD(P)/FAD-dependent oxidoreductase n=1 Tax=Acutalibacteraceae TaxID=3082771 RepID=UPI000FFE0256|nr:MULTISPECIES: NAD(P)/FAD-dependent oxidoreductase [Acutalibacteraceae]QAT51040.1 NAD(P)/FAD-dependent oxidoreductase [Caproiciproducens sp. NJN-50]